MRINNHFPLPPTPAQGPRCVGVVAELPDQFVRAASGAAAAAAGAMVEGVGMAAITLRHTPAGIRRAYHDLYTSEHGGTYRGSWSLGILAAAALASPLAGVLGAGLGAYGGALSGYHQGFGPAMQDCLEGLRQFDRLVGDTLVYEPGRSQ